jgi:hypothetical protein
MRNHFIDTILIAGVLCAPLFAQKVEIFGGAQYEHLQSSYNAVGWNASLTGNFKHVLGITADFSGLQLRRTTLDLPIPPGPVLTRRRSVQLFVRALFGGSPLRQQAGATTRCNVPWRRQASGFAKRIGLRLVQAD